MRLSKALVLSCLSSGLVLAASTASTSVSATSTSNTTATTTTAQTGSMTTCGPSNGNSVCAQGFCYSTNGYCGVGDAYCGTGCQSSFGQCGTATSSFQPGPTGSTTVCGPSNNNTVCAEGYCCSASQFCGKGEAYCADPECLYNFGDCDSSQTPAGPSTKDDPRPLLGNLTYTKDIYHCTIPGVTALTFDDGPLNTTYQVLDLLKQFGFHATFFICGNNLGKGEIDITEPYPELIKRMIDEGHQVASHTYSHYNLDELTTAQRIDQITKNERAIANIIGKYPTYLRPPYSSCQNSTGCQADIQALGYHRVYFDLDTEDYLHDDPIEIQESKDIVKAAYQGNSTQDLLSIQHDIIPQAANMTLYHLQAIKAKGWRGVTVGECLNDPRQNWYRVPGGNGLGGGNGPVKPQPQGPGGEPSTPQNQKPGNFPWGSRPHGSGGQARGNHRGSGGRWRL